MDNQPADPFASYTNSATPVLATVQSVNQPPAGDPFSPVTPAVVTPPVVAPPTVSAPPSFDDLPHPGNLMPPASQPPQPPQPLPDLAPLPHPSTLSPNPVPPPPQPVVPPAPISVPKEMATTTLSPQELKIHDTTEGDKVAKSEGDVYWENYAKEIEIEKEIAELGGVEKVESGEVKLPEAIAKEMGIQPTVTIETPIKKTLDDFTVRGVTLSDDQLNAGMKKPTTSAFRWLVEWFVAQLKKAHYVVKSVGGKMKRQAPSVLS